MKSVNSKNIDEYISAFPPEIQERLTELRECILKAAKDAEEKISYGIPTFVFNGNLVHFGGYENHIGFYPGASAIKKFSPKLERYKCSKGTVQFPHDTNIPLKLITQIVNFRKKENAHNASLKKSKRKKIKLP